MRAHSGAAYTFSKRVVLETSNRLRRVRPPLFMDATGIMSDCDIPIECLRELATAQHLTDGWHPFQCDPDLYPQQLGDAFRVAIFAEIESRLNELPKVSVAGAADREATVLLLAQLQEQLHAGVAE